MNRKVSICMNTRRIAMNDNVCTEVVRRPSKTIFRNVARARILSGRAGFCNSLGDCLRAGLCNAGKNPRGEPLGCDIMRSRLLNGLRRNRVRGRGHRFPVKIPRRLSRPDRSSCDTTTRGHSDWERRNCCSSDYGNPTVHPSNFKTSNVKLQSYEV